MLDQAGPWKAVLSALFFPLFFQNEFLSFVWGAQDPLWMALLKRITLLLPVGAIILGCWMTSANTVTILIRHKRAEFVIAVLTTWWDLVKSILGFWGGMLKFVVALLLAVVGLVRLLIVGLWVTVQDIILVPFAVLRGIGANLVAPGFPMLAVILTLVWVVVESTIFTFVTSSLVVDTLSNITGGAVSESFVRIPLFLFMLFIVLGSYAVLTSWTEMVKSKNVIGIVKIGSIELVTIFVEVVFLYREFVDSLAPWFAQHSAKGADLGLVGTLVIATLCWFGVRGMSWFLFAAHGAPVIMSVIQGEGTKYAGGASAAKNIRAFHLSLGVIDQLKKETDWLRTTGEELLAAFLLPPLQVVAAAINFCTLFVISQHLFSLPLKTMQDVMEPKFPSKKGRKSKEAA